MFKRMSKAQSTAEYAIVIGLVIAAAVAMQVYVKRGLQGRIHDAVSHQDTDTGAMFTGNQYEPYYLGSDMTSTRSAQEGEVVGTGGTVNRTRNEETTRTGTQTIEDVTLAD